MHAPFTERSAPDDIDRRVLEIVESLLAELSGPPLRRPVALGDSLDRDLGIGSLERVELLLRLEEVFGVRLPEDVMAGAECPRDLADAIRSAAPSEFERIPQPRPPVAPGVAAPGDARTLVDVLRWHVQAHPDRVHIFLRQEDETETPISYGSLWTRSMAVAAGLRGRGIGPGHPVALMLRTEAAFFTAFFGVLLAGGIPIPIYPPFRLDRIEEYAQRQIGILRNAEARLLILFPEAERIARLLRGRVPSLQGLVTVEQMASQGAGEALPHPFGGDPALIQYTSGSTGAPKGVLLSHGNILANIRAIGRAIAIGPDDVGVSWLPLYHDMGLIGAWLTPLYFGIPVTIFSPLAFLSRPVRWLRAIHTRRATLTPAPNFAFDLCVRKVSDAEIAGLDLSSWRLALNGAEPVSPLTIRRFTDRFAPYGFRPETMCPVYGLAESSVALTIPPVGRGPRLDRVVREPFQSARVARPAAPDDPGAVCFVSCGRPLPEHEIRIMDEADDSVGERIEGHIQFRGPSVTRGYYRNPEATREVLHEGWMDSGDLGYWADGELFITGRCKDLIIKAGRNLYPQEIEEVIGELPDVRKGCVAAFGLADPEIGTERLVIVAESRVTAPERLAAVRAAAIDRVVSVVGIPPDVVVVAPPGSVLKTSSGKIRRTATRDAYCRGELTGGTASAAMQLGRLFTQYLWARLRRIGTRAGLLAYAVYVGTLLAVTVPPLWAGLRLLRDRRGPDRLLRIWCRGVFALSGCRIGVRGMEHLRGAAPAVLVANHASYLDAGVLLAVLPVEFYFVAKQELASRPLIGLAIRKAGHLTVERGAAFRSLADADRTTAALRSGTSLLVFAEGTFIRPPGLLPFRLGAFKAAVEAGRPVIPIGLRGTREILPSRTWLPKPGSIMVVIGAPMTPRGSGWPEMVRLRDRARAEVAHLTGEPFAPGRR